MKLFIFLSVVFILQISAASQHDLPFPIHHDDEKIIQKREAFVPGKDKIPPFRHTDDKKIEETFGRQKRGIFSDQIPPVIHDEGNDKINGQMTDNLIVNSRAVIDNSDKMDLPLLMKIHRLRPGSKVYQDMISKYLESQKGQQKSDDVPLPGEGMIGGNRHPKNDKNERDRVGIMKREIQNGQDSEMPLLLKTQRLRPGSGAYNEVINKYIIKGEHNGQMLQGEDKKVDDEPRLLGEKLIPKNRHPISDKIDLPLLMKIHRLRPGSKDYKEIIEKYVNSQKDQQQESSDNEVPLPGENMIGRNRHPKVGDLPFPIHHDDEKIIQKREAFVPGKDKIPPVIHDEGNDKINGQMIDNLIVKEDTLDLAHRYDRIVSADHGI